MKGAECHVPESISCMASCRVCFPSEAMGSDRMALNTLLRRISVLVLMKTSPTEFTSRTYLD
eukprot:2420560-Pleurochrysis_carterae.AAC.2